MAARMPPVLLAEPQRDEQINGLADQLVASIAKEPFGLGILQG